jgi:O-antigen/teichoic acid export membrane protein
MSRFKRFAHSLASGYLLLGTNVVFTLAHIPLALHYLSKSEFGLWALTTQITGYLLMLDLGMSGYLVRNLKDDKGEVDGFLGVKTPRFFASLRQCLRNTH